MLSWQQFTPWNPSARIPISNAPSGLQLFSYDGDNLLARGSEWSRTESALANGVAAVKAYQLPSISRQSLYVGVDVARKHDLTVIDYELQARPALATANLPKTAL